MGLAVLPSRLKEELEILADYLVNHEDIRSNEKIANMQTGGNIQLQI